MHIRKVVKLDTISAKNVGSQKIASLQSSQDTLTTTQFSKEAAVLQLLKDRISQVQ